MKGSSKGEFEVIVQCLSFCSEKKNYAILLIIIRKSYHFFVVCRIGDKDASGLFDIFRAVFTFTILFVLLLSLSVFVVDFLMSPSKRVNIYGGFVFRTSYFFSAFFTGG